MDKTMTIFATVIVFFMIAFVVLIAHIAGETSVRQDMIQCNRVAQNLDRCYQSIILGEKL
jgi:hypothetical protein